LFVGVKFIIVIIGKLDLLRPKFCRQISLRVITYIYVELTGVAYNFECNSIYIYQFEKEIKILLTKAHNNMNKNVNMCLKETC
jgi:hypothetical protein